MSDQDEAPITEDDVRHVARLARIALNDADVKHFTSHLLKVLNNARELETLDLDDVPMWRHPYGLSNVLREDEVAESQILDRTEVLSQAPDTDSPASADEAKFFKVPSVLGDSP